MIRRPPRATLTYTLLPYTTLCLSLVCTTIPASATGRERPRHRSKLTPRGIRAIHPPGGSVVRPHVVLSSQTGIDHAQSPARPPDALVRPAELSQAVPADRGAVRRRCPRAGHRSEEHTSELQSLMRISYAVFCLKKKNYTYSRRTVDRQTD